MLKLVTIAIFAKLVFGASCEEALPGAVSDIKQMPVAWRPLANSKLSVGLSQAPWSAQETLDAERAVERGLDEMRDFLNGHRRRILRLNDNAVEAVLDVAYGASAQPALQKRAFSEATSLLEICAQPWMKRSLRNIRPTDFGTLVTLAIYAHQLMPAESAITAGLVARCNRSLQVAGSLPQATGFDVRTLSLSTPIGVDRAFDLNMWCVELIGAQTVPGLNSQPEMREFLRVVWPYLAAYPLPNARDYSNGANDPTFYGAAYLATHVAYIPTGYGRHALFIGDAPALYRYLRENFYYVLEIGELDLLAEFVDLLRQLGCTEENDLQVRGGTRYLMRLYHEAGDSWLAIRDKTELRGVSEYNLLHKPWTGIAGVRRRVFEETGAGTYGAIFRAVFPAPRCGTQ